MTGSRVAMVVGPLVCAVVSVGALARPATRARADAAADEGPATRMRDRRPGLLDDDAVAAREAPMDERDEAMMRDRRRRGANGDDWFRNPFQYGGDNGQVYGGFPSAHVQEAVIANARRAATSAIFRRAESALGSAVRQARRSFETSAEYRDAVKAERDAYQHYTDARRMALDTLRENPRYQGLVRLREELSDQLVSRRRTHAVSEADERFVDDVLGMASLKMSYGTQARQMERERIGDDAGIREALQNYRTASAHVAEMRNNFDNTMRADEDLIAARNALADARIAKLTAGVYFQGAAEAANEALDFAYYLHRYDGSSVYSDFRYFYPYSYPFWGGSRVVVGGGLP
jgi:hypothetical protein